GSQRAWGEAMCAELAAIGDPAERRRFALGCAGAALRQRTLARSAGTLACAAALVALVPSIGPTVPLMLILGLLLALGRRPGHLGPCRPGAAHGVRATGWALVLGLLATQVVDGGVHGLLHPAHAGVVWTLALAGLATAFTAATARATRIGESALATGLCAGLVTGAVGFAVLPYERIGTPLADSLPWHGQWLVGVVFAAPALSALITAARTRSSDQTVMAAASAGTLAALTVALLGLGSIVLFPHSVPDIVGPVMSPGTSAAARQAANATEASDPYAGFLVFGGLLALLLWALARPPGKADLKLLLLTGLTVPAVALALAGNAGTIALATAAVALVAAVRTRRGAAATT
ncbi:MAG TPA: hypothetical protein VGK92_15625, partial [Gaiellales bacterium]